MECHIQLFHVNVWIDCVVVAALDPRLGGVSGHSFFEYELEYVFGGPNEPVSLTTPIDATNQTL